MLALLYALRAAGLRACFWRCRCRGSSVLLFAASLGFLWLGTVPLTSGLVGYMFGPTHMSMLWGIVFFSHQLGSFLGGWGAGRLYDVRGNYDAMWWISGRARRSGRPAALADPRTAGAASRDGAGAGMTERAGGAGHRARLRNLRRRGHCRVRRRRTLRVFSGLPASRQSCSRVAAFVLWTRDGAGILLDMMLSLL